MRHPVSGNWESLFICCPYGKKIKTFREEFWNADTGEIICNVTAQYGDEKYGSTDKVFNEKDYITILPCIYGFQPGLQVQYLIFEYNIA